MLFSIIVILIVVIAGALLLLHLRMLRAIRDTSNIPCPPLVPILGNVLEFSYTSGDIFKDLIKIGQTYGPTVQIWLGPVHRVLLSNDLNLFELILSSTTLIKKSSQYVFFNQWLGEGLFLSEGQKWQKRRKIIMPAFHFSILEKSVDTFQSMGQVLIEQLGKHCERGAFDVYPYINLYGHKFVDNILFRFVPETAMGFKIDAQLNSNSKYVSAVHDICDIIHNRMFSLFTSRDFIFDHTPQGRRFKECVKFVHSMTDDVILTRRKLLTKKLKGENGQTADNDLGIKNRPVFLDVLLQATIDGQPLTNAEIRDEAGTFMFAGHDAISSAISFTLYLLANNPDIQDKVIKEIQQILGKDVDKFANYANLNDMKYLEAVIKESMRIYPPVPMYGRHLTHDIEIHNQIIPKGTNVMLFPFLIQRDPDIYPEPEKFIPDRFLDHTLQRNPYVYTPFSAGPRNCIGQKFAMLEIKSVISTILRNYELLPTAGPGYEPQLRVKISLQSYNGIQIRIKQRHF